MVSEQKVRMMIRLAEYESHEGKQDFARTKYYKMDYIRLQILKTLVCVTCAVVLIAVMTESGTKPLTNARIIDNGIPYSRSSFENGSWYKMIL